MSLKKKAVGYLRRSTKDQEASLDDQRTSISAYAKKNGYEVIDWYVDDGISGDDTHKRYAFLQMRDDTKTGKFKYILCWDQDRFGRFDSMEAGYWIFPLREQGVTLDTVTEGPIKWDDFTGRIMYGIVQEGKHKFLQDLSANVLRGQVEAARKGSWIGTPPYGYDLKGDTKHKTLVPDEVRLSVVRRIFHEFAVEGLSMATIAAGLTNDGIATSRGQSRWRGDAVKFILENPVYVGTFRYNRNSRAKYHTLQRGEIVKVGRRGVNPEEDWITITDHHPAVVERDQFDRAQQILAKGKTGRSSYTPETNPYLFAGKLRCGRCGANLWGIDKCRYKCSNERADRSCLGTSINEQTLLGRLAEIIELKIFGNRRKTLLTKIAANKGKVDETTLPEAFGRLKTMMLGTDQYKRQVDRKALKNRIDRMDSKIKKARENLVHISNPMNIAAAEMAIDKMEVERDELYWDYKCRPKEEDINKTVREVISKLWKLTTADKECIAAVLREIDFITIHTTTQGQGSGTRHTLKSIDVSFYQPGVVPSKSNPHPPGFEPGRSALLA